ncbi:sensor histidine kinase [Streptomyces sp. ST2-7A]|uniref:sensor histidine kinase n=1 Tax=Streptomyces sp. ST2-7A TaxID=2907214 RepID=UPI001F360A1D|nr:ATP-binding protein [Streptomyces sp. ST2-7A]MCE7079046.1 ATP-binding protein [Streptomyces sp. ST2-7A]
MTAHTPPVRRWTEQPPPRRTLLALLVTLVPSAGLGLWGVYAAPESFRVPLAWGAGVGILALCLTVATAVRSGERAERLRERIGALEAAERRLSEEHVPALIARLRENISADAALASVTQPESPAHRTVLRQFAEEIGHSETSRASAMSACANAAGRMQAMATGMLADLRAMEHRHADPDVLTDLLYLDHRTAQAGRLADSIAVLTGARSGRRWAKPIVMESILRGAMGRIAGYQRVRLHSSTDVAIAGHAAEGVMHALAELLDNAANFSPPTAEVHVYVEEVPSGIIITIEDSGLVMSETALRRAERAVSSDPRDLTALSGTRLGLAVVGRLARKHGLSVSFRPSARGGTGALVRVPQELITRPRSAPPTAPVTAPAAARSTVAPAESTAPAAPAAGSAPVDTREHTAVPDRADTSPAPGGSRRDGGGNSEDTASVPEFSTGGLPKRRRGRTLANANANANPTGSRDTPAAPRRPAREHSPAESAARFGAFRSAVRRPADGAGDGPETPPDSTAGAATTNPPNVPWPQPATADPDHAQQQSPTPPATTASSLPEDESR